MLFRSAVICAGAKTAGVLLTGMGSDGASGLKGLRDSGARTIVQDENTSVVWGMPGTAVELGAAESIVPLGQIANQLVSVLRGAEPAMKKVATE